MDAALFVKEQQNSFDVIIVDSSDPVGTDICNVINRSCWKLIYEFIL